MAQRGGSLQAAALIAGALALGGPAAAEVFIYTTADGQTLYSDRVRTGGGLVPRNAAARRGVVRWSGPARPVVSVSAADRAAVDRLIERLAPAYRLDPALVRRVVAAESAYQVRAVSPKNAQGLMQLIPATQARFGVGDPFDAEQNLRGGMAYLRWLLAQFHGDVRLALAGYNAGEGAVRRHGGVPPYAETRAYVARIAGQYGKGFHPYVAGADGGVPAAGAVRAELRAAAGTGPAAQLESGARLIAAGRGGDAPRMILAGGSGGR